MPSSGVFRSQIGILADDGEPSHLSGRQPSQLGSIVSLILAGVSPLRAALRRVSDGQSLKRIGLNLLANQMSRLPVAALEHLAA